MDVAFLEDGAIKFILVKNGVYMQFRIARPFKFGIDKWRFIRNGGIGEIRYEGCKMSDTHSNMTLIFYEGQSGSGTYQWIRLVDGFLELGIDLERGKKTRASSIITIPLPECYDAIDKLIDHYEKV